MHFVELNHESYYGHSNKFNQLRKIVKFVQFNCLSYFDYLASLNNLAWLCGLCSWSYRASYPFCAVEPINPVWAFEQHQPFQIDIAIFPSLIILTS